MHWWKGSRAYISSVLNCCFEKTGQSFIKHRYYAISLVVKKLKKKDLIILFFKWTLFHIFQLAHIISIKQALKWLLLTINTIILKTSFQKELTYNCMWTTFFPQNICTFVCLKLFSHIISCKHKQWNLQEQTPYSFQYLHK